MNYRIPIATLTVILGCVAGAQVPNIGEMLDEAGFETGLPLTQGEPNSMQREVRGGQSLPPIAQVERRVSAAFDKASLDEVVRWLKSSGANFVVNHDQAPKDVRISLSFRNVPIGEALDALGAAMGGYWQRRGSVYVYRPGNEQMMFGMPVPGVMTADGPRPDLPPTPNRLGGLPITEGVDGAFVAPVPQMPVPNDSIANALQRAREGLRTANAKSRDAETLGAIDLALKEIERAIRELQSRQGSPLPPADSLRGRFEPMPPVMTAPSPPGGYRWSGDPQALVSTLTAGQREKIAKQGYLLLSDLTPAQRASIGNPPPDGDFTLNIEVSTSGRKQQFQVLSKPPKR